MNTTTLEHSDFCESQNAPYFNSGCDTECDYYREAVKECVDIGEHFRRIVSVNGYDVCDNCGVRA
jgi:hypothetical protein